MISRYCCCCPSPGEAPTKETFEMNPENSMATISSGRREEEIKVTSGMKRLKMDDWDMVIKENDTAVREENLKVGGSNQYQDGFVFARK